MWGKFFPRPSGYDINELLDWQQFLNCITEFSSVKCLKENDKGQSAWPLFHVQVVWFQPAARINAGNWHFCKPRICWNFTSIPFFGINFQFDGVTKLCLCSKTGTKTTWLGSCFGLKYLLSSQWKCRNILSKIFSSCCRARLEICRRSP